MILVNDNNVKKVIGPNIFTIADNASGTRRNVVYQLAIDKVLAQIKNMHELATIVKNMLLYINVPQKIALSCSSLLMPFVNNSMINAIAPIAINAKDQVLVFAGISKYSLIVVAAIVMILSLKF